jgi:hypothetical protein
MFMEEGELLEGRKHSNLDAGVAKERASVLIIRITIQSTGSIPKE